MTMPLDRRKDCQRPRSEMSAGTARTMAAMLTRAVTAAAGDHPASMRDLASAPDVLNAADAPTATARPRRAWLLACIAPPRPRVTAASSVKVHYSNDTIGSARQEST